MFKRDPRFSKAELTCLWELEPVRVYLLSIDSLCFRITDVIILCQSDSSITLPQLVRHAHPSVAFFAKAIIANKPIDYKGDPIQDFTLSKYYC